MADETTILALDILDKLGYSGESAGTGDVFQYLANLLSYDQTVAGNLSTLLSRIGTINPTSGDLSTLFKGLKLISDYVDTLETKIGTNTDTAGTSTLFARLAQIVGYVDELESRLTTTRAAYLDYLNNLNTRLTDTRAGKLDLIGTNTDAAGTATLFARLAQIAEYTDQVEGYVDTLESNLGTTGDAASATGSAHAKLADIKNYLVNTILSTINTQQKPRGPAGAYGYFATNELTYQTALNITGAGRLVALKIKTTGTSKVRLTLDGNIVSYCKNATTSQPYYPTNDFLFTLDESVVALDSVANGGRALLGIEFKTSLKIELARITDTVYIYWYYEIA